MAPTLADAGTVSSELATCSSPEDERRIRMEIEASAGYAMIDRAVRRTLAGVQWHMFGAWVKYTIIQVLPVCAFVMLVTDRVSAVCVLVVLACFYGIMVCAVYVVARRMYGGTLMPGPSLVLPCGTPEPIHTQRSSFGRMCAARPTPAFPRNRVKSERTNRSPLTKQTSRVWEDPLQLMWPSCAERMQRQTLRRLVVEVHSGHADVVANSACAQTLAPPSRR